jgi:predicted PurR-regulated permease PerM
MFDGSGGRSRWRRLLWAAAIVVLAAILYAARDALTPFAIGGIVAFLLAPVVDRLRAMLPFRSTRPELATTVAVLVIYVAALSVFAAVLLTVVPRVVNQVSQLAVEAPAITRQAQDEVERRVRTYRQIVPRNMQAYIDEQAARLAEQAGNWGVLVVQQVLALLTSGFASLVAFIVVPFWLYYLLRDREAGTSAFVRLFPVEVRGDVRALVLSAANTFGSYIRAQLLLATLIGIVTWLGLAWLGVPFALLLGVITGVFNLIPVLGPMIGGIPVLIISFAALPGLSTLWVFLFLFVTQNLKDYVIAPRIQGDAVKIHPAVVLLLLVVAGKLAGIWGLLLVVPVAAVVRDVFMHVQRRLRDGPEVRPAPAEVLAGRAGD